MAKKEMHPDEYGDLMLEAMRVVASGPDEAIIPFQIWDMDDFDNELSIVFRATGFEKAERLFALKELIRDVWYGDGGLVVLTDKAVRRYSGSFKKPTSTTELPITAARAIDGTAENLIVVGEGIARFDGVKWTKLPTKQAVELTHVVVRGDVAYAGGKGGVVLAISGDKVKILRKGGAEISALGVDDEGILSVASRDGALQGPPDQLAPLALPKEVNHAAGVCSFQGKTYWGTVGDGEGMGIFRQDGARLEPVAWEMGVTMTATDRFLFAPGEGGVVRYDGEHFRALALDFDEDEEKWKLEVPEDEDEDEDE